MLVSAVDHRKVAIGINCHILLETIKLLLGGRARGRKRRGDQDG